MSSLARSFKEARNISKVTSQYKCCRYDTHVWWGGNHEMDSVCDQCGSYGEKLHKFEMIGIGWFQCDCKRIFAGFCRGNVPSKCHGCNRDVDAAFVVEGNNAGDAERTEQRHECNACLGRGHCPVVEEAKRISGGRAR
jgi:hypothetical protein